MSNQLYRNNNERYNYLEHPVSNKGDIHVGTGSGGIGDNLPIGVDGLILVADSAQPLGLKWGTAGSSAIPDPLPVDVIIERTPASGITMSSKVLIPANDLVPLRILTDTIDEFTPANGVIIEDVKLTGNNIICNTIETNTIDDKTGGGLLTIGGVVITGGQVRVDTIVEKTNNAGTIVEGVLLKDNIVYTDTISEKTFSVGVSFNNEIYLPTSGGTPSPLSYYEEYTELVTYAGGFTVNPTNQTVDIVKIGNIINVYIHPFAGVSNATTAITSSTLLPTRFRPVATTTIACQVFDNNLRILGYVSILNTGAIFIETCNMTSGQPGLFTASGSKGIQRNICITYTTI